MYNAKTCSGWLFRPNSAWCNHTCNISKQTISYDSWIFQLNQLDEEKIEEPNPQIQNVKTLSSAAAYFSLTRKTKKISFIWRCKHINWFNTFNYLFYHSYKTISYIYFVKINFWFWNFSSEWIYIKILYVVKRNVFKILKFKLWTRVLKLIPSKNWYNS